MRGIVQEWIARALGISPREAASLIGVRVAQAQLADCDNVIELFGALHTYNASLDPHFALSDGWDNLLRSRFREGCQHPDQLWLLAKDGNRSVGLLIMSVHTNSLIFKHHYWAEVEDMYIVSNHRGTGLASVLLERACAWARTRGLLRIQLYVTCGNSRALAFYGKQGFTITQFVMRKEV